MLAGNSSRDAQAQPDAPLGRIAPPLAPVERRKDPLLFAWRNSRSVVVDHNHDAIIVMNDFYTRVPSIFDRVVDQVRHRTANEGRPAGHVDAATARIGDLATGVRDVLTN